jgi:sugar diacid utilization regulator
MSSPADGSAGPDLSALDAVTDAVASGAGLPDVVRAAARALDATLVVADRAGGILAVAARSPADERAVLAGGEGIEVLELRLGDRSVGQLRMRARGGATTGVVRLVATLLAGEVERLRAPARASQEAAVAFLAGVLDRDVRAAEDIAARGRELGLELREGASVLVARAHAHAPADEGWRARVLGAVDRGARSGAADALAVALQRSDTSGAEVVVLVPGPDEARATRAAEAALRELQAGLPGNTFALGRSRVAADPAELHRAGSEALLAANVAEGTAERVLLAFEDTGSYRLLLPAMSEDPAELQRFYADTIEPLAAYDGQYETELVRTVEAYLDNDANVAATAQTLFTHRHTVRYRLERVRDLSGLDMASTDGRERLSLGLKAMRVLGIQRPAGPAREAGAGAGRVPPRR